MVVVFRGVLRGVWYSDPLKVRFVGLESDQQRRSLASERTELRLYEDGSDCSGAKRPPVPRTEENALI